MSERRWPKKKFLLIAAAVLVGILLTLFTVASMILEPLLKKRLHSLIINGSDSLYHYSFGSLKADVFGANINVKDLKIWIDSSRYRQMRMQNTLPALTFSIDMKQGQIKGISLLAILAGNKLKIQEINSEQGQLTLARHYTKKGEVARNEKPFWKAIQPAFEGISIGEIRLDNMQFAYWDLGPKDVQLRFERCDALLQDVKVDSAMLADTTRIGYLQHLSFRLQGLAYLSADSVYKLNVGDIRYSSDDKQMEVERFSLQPSNAYSQLLRLDTVAKTYFTLQAENMRFQNIRLEQFINANTIRADSLVLQSPVLSVYFDRSAPKDMKSKVGNFPHQLLAKSPITLDVKQLWVPDMQVTYTEKSDRTEKEGIVSLHDLTIQAANLTNDPDVIKSNPVCTMQASGKILGSSPITTRFTLYLDAPNGNFDAEGSIKNITDAQLSPLAENLASMRIPSLTIDEVLFSIKAENDSGWGNVRMRYNGLEVQLLKTDKQTGDTVIRNFLSKLLNRYMVHPSNPGPDGIERMEERAFVNRLLWHSFFGLIWRTIFTGVQNIVLRS